MRALARAAHAETLERVPAGLRASLPVDATGVTQAIEILATAVGIDAEVLAERDRLNRANPAVLHGRVFGRAPLAPETVVAAFAEGARVRAILLERVAVEIDGDALRAAYDAQERAVLLCAGRLDARGA